MEISEMSRDDQSLVNKLRLDYKLEKDDPFVGLLIELVTLKRVIIELVKSQQDGVQQLISDLKNKVSQITETLETQKSVAAVLQSQVAFYAWIKRMGLVFGMGLLISGMVLGYLISNYVSESGRLAKKIQSTGAAVTIHENGSNQEFIINSPNIQSASRDQNRVTITLRSSK